MFDIQTICSTIEKKNGAERETLLRESSLTVIKGLKALGARAAQSIKALAAFIIGSTVSDGTLCEKRYLFIFPSLIKAFGKECDIAELKRAYKTSADIQKELDRCVRAMLDVFKAASDSLKEDILCLCLLFAAEDGKITSAEKRYVRKLSAC